MRSFAVIKSHLAVVTVDIKVGVHSSHAHGTRVNLAPQADSLGERLHLPVGTDKREAALPIGAKTNQPPAPGFVHSRPTDGRVYGFIDLIGNQLGLRQLQENLTAGQFPFPFARGGETIELLVAVPQIGGDPRAIRQECTEPFASGAIPARHTHLRQFFTVSIEEPSLFRGPHLQAVRRHAPKDGTARIMIRVRVNSGEDGQRIELCIPRRSGGFDFVFWRTVAGHFIRNLRLLLVILVNHRFDQLPREIATLGGVMFRRPRVVKNQHLWLSGGTGVKRGLRRDAIRRGGLGR